jgi:hypothetical protein
MIEPGPQLVALGDGGDPLGRVRRGAQPGGVRPDLDHAGEPVSFLDRVLRPGALRLGDRPGRFGAAPSLACPAASPVLPTAATAPLPCGGHQGRVAVPSAGRCARPPTAAGVVLVPGIPQGAVLRDGSIPREDRCPPSAHRVADWGASGRNPRSTRWLLLVSCIGVRRAGRQPRSRRETRRRNAVTAARTGICCSPRRRAKGKAQCTGGSPRLAQAPATSGPPSSDRNRWLLGRRHGRSRAAPCPPRPVPISRHRPARDRVLEQNSRRRARHAATRPGTRGSGGTGLRTSR